MFEKTLSGKQPAVVSYDKPSDGALRVVGTGHSFMAPGYKTFPVICQAAGMTQPLYTHTGGGITGSARGTNGNRRTASFNSTANRFQNFYRRSRTGNGTR